MKITSLFRRDIKQINRNLAIKIMPLAMGLKEGGGSMPSGQPTWADIFTAWFKGEEGGKKSPGYWTNWAVHAVIDKIAVSSASVFSHAHLFRRIDKEEKEIFDDPIIDKLKWRPNPYQSYTKFIKFIMVNLLTDGNAYIWVPGGFKNPTIFWPLSSSKVEIEFNTAKDIVDSKNIVNENHIKKFKYNNTDKRPEEIIHHSLVDPDNIFKGKSPIVAVQERVASEILSEIWNRETIANGGMTPFAAVAEGMLSDEQYQEFASWVYRKWRNKQSGMPWPIDRNLRIEQIGMKPQDMEFQALHEIVMRVVANVFGVPSELIGDAKNKTYSNQQEAWRQLYLSVAIPAVNELLDTFNYHLFPDRKKRFKIKQSDIEQIKEDSTEQMRKVDGISFIEQNEKRAMFGLDQSDDFKDLKFFIPVNMRPLQLVKEELDGGGEEPEDFPEEVDDDM